jgi:hypothetical protein
MRGSVFDLAQTRALTFHGEAEMARKDPRVLLPLQLGSWTTSGVELSHFSALYSEYVSI